MSVFPEAGRQAVNSVSHSVAEGNVSDGYEMEELYPSLLPDESAPVMLEEKSAFPSCKEAGVTLHFRVRPS